MSGNKIGRITTASSQPEGITAGPDGNLWFTDFNVSNIGRITPSGSFTFFGIPTAKSGPLGITAGPAHTRDVWFTEASKGKIGRISTK